MSLGTLFFIIVISVGIILLGGLTYLGLHISKVLPYVKNKIGGINFSNAAIRFLIEGYFEFALSLGVNI